VEFLGVGYQELLLILVLMLVVVGPERLPGMAYQIGRAVRTMQNYARQVRDEFSDEIGYIEEQYRTVKGEVDSTRESLRTQQVQLNNEFRTATEPLRTNQLAGVLSVPGSDSSGSSTNVVSIADGQPITAAPETDATLAASEPEAPPKSEAPPLVF
jgi:sec-independent protein translocase protein TatB